MNRNKKLGIMAPPTPKSCYMPNCDYSTTAGIPNYELLMKDLEMHIKCVHHVQQLGQTETQGGIKPDRLPRPTVGEGITEADWKHFLDKWGRYKRSSLKGSDPQHVADQLWACCEPSLETAVYNSGITGDSNEEKLLEMMKKLAVRAQNTLVNVVKFLDLAQDQEESVGAYTARLKGQASICDFSIKCKSAACGIFTSYAEKMAMRCTPRRNSSRGFGTYTADLSRSLLLTPTTTVLTHP